MSRQWFALMALGLAACGGSDLDPGAGDDRGTGTSTLGVEGAVRASPRIANAKSGDDFDVEFSVRITLNGQTVTTGNVTVTSSTGKVALAYRSDSRWTGSAGRYDQVYVLDVDAGPDKAQGIRVDGPGVHVFTRPAAGAVLDATKPVEVAWDRDVEADTATVRAENLDALQVTDTGAYTFAAGSLKTDKAEPRTQELRVGRTNRVTPGGAIAGSTWAVTIDNELAVVAQPAP